MKLKLVSAFCVCSVWFYKWSWQILLLWDRLFLCALNFRFSNFSLPFNLVLNTFLKIRWDGFIFCLFEFHEFYLFFSSFIKLSFCNCFMSTHVFSYIYFSFSNYQLLTPLKGTGSSYYSSWSTPTWKKSNRTT